jgi:hypothetical protein
MLPALDNFVSYGADIFKQRPDYRGMMVDIYSTAMNSDQLGENDRVNGCKLAESMMLNLREHVDNDVRAPTLSCRPNYSHQLSYRPYAPSSVLHSLISAPPRHPHSS